MKKKRILLPVCVLGGLLVLCLGAYGLLSWFGSPLLPGSLERRCAREVETHGEELSAFAQTCLETDQVPETLPLPGLVKEADVWGQGTQAFVEFTCGGWGLGSSTSYYGVYYSPSGPQPFQGAGVELTPQEDGWAWQGEGDNQGFTRPLGGDFYYFEAHF